MQILRIILIVCFAFTAYPSISLFAEELKRECKEIGKKDDCGNIRDVRSF